MTPDQFIKLVEALGPSLLGLFALIGTIVTAAFAYRASARIAAVEAATHQQTRTIDATSAKADTIIEKAVEIHATTNGQLTKMTSALEVSNAKLEAMRDTVATMVDDKRATAVVAEKLAEKIAVPPPGVVINGTLETKK